MSLPKPAPDIWQRMNRPGASVRYFFCGEPADYAAFFVPPRVAPQAQPLQGPMPPGPSGLAALPPWEVPLGGPRTAGLPFFLAPLSQEAVRDLKRFMDQTLDVPIADRRGRAFHFSIVITEWRAFVHDSDDVEMRGLTALEQFIGENHWREITVSIDDGPQERLFRSAKECVAKAIRPYLPPEKANRLSHLRRAARFYLKLRARHLPTPPNLNRLEEISRKENGIELYTAVVAKNGGGLPTSTQLEAVCEGGLAALDRGPSRAANTWQARVEPCFTLLQEYANARQDPVLDDIVLRFELAIKGPKPTKKNVVDTGSDTSCPFHFVETEHALTITVDPLPDPFPYQARAQMPKAARWSVADRPEGGMEVVVALKANRGEARHQRLQALNWAAEICTRLNRPLPTITNPA